MAHIDALIDKVADTALRAALREQVDSLLQKRSFGLVFQEHRPETVELPQHRVRRGCKVRVGAEQDQALYRVDRISGDAAAVTSLTEPPVQRNLPRSELVVVREFGDPVYPGLASTGSVHRGGAKAAHVVINAENFHALETLLYTHEGKVDAIYIDPPYNTRDKDWKYNNDYVDSDDVYRHSKWLAMMQRRLWLAARLLNPDDSVLMVTIDEKEYLRLGLLLEQTFPQGRIQMVSSNINPAGASRSDAFGRSDEYIFLVMLGSAVPSRVLLSKEWVSERGRTHTGTARWDLLRRSGSEAARTDRPSGFYPIYVDVTKPEVVHVGDPLPLGTSSAPTRSGTVAVLPIRKDGSEGRWMLGPEELKARIKQGRVRLNVSRDRRRCVLYYLADGEYSKVQANEYVVVGHRPDGSMVFPEVDAAEVVVNAVPSTQWRITSHDSTQYGSRLLSAFLPGRAFPFPKSLYAVEDALRFFLINKPEALVLDFFAGSGTTLHAVARLNKQDGGRRRCICVTNNEVSEQEAVTLAAQGHRPGDAAWETLGICEYITKPRVQAALTGQTHLGQPVAGAYKFTDPFPMSQGLEENAEFFNLTYEDPDLISLGKKFQAIAPLLWLKAGGRGTLLETVVEPWALAPDAHYAVLFDTDQWREFVDEVGQRDDLAHLFIVTDSDATFQQVSGELPRNVECTQLYEDYLHNFQINTRGRR